MGKGRRPKAGKAVASNPLPSCPEWLGPLAREEWARVSTEVSLTSVDVAILAGYCQQFALWRDAVDVIKRDGMMISGRKHPACTVIDACLKQLRSLAAELGFTPASRGRLDNATTPPSQERGELEAFDI